MRIRTIKPEFWRSDDITALPMDVRLLFIGLWSYVDDNGVGIDDYRQITADLFALEEDQAAIRKYVREGLVTLSRGLQVVRYMIDDRPYVFIRSWDRHQKVDRPSKPRYPRPPTDFDPSTSRNGYDPDHVATPSRPLATPSPRGRVAGTGEQGNRGTGEKPTTPTASATTPHNAQTLVAWWIDHCQKRPPNNVIGQVSRTIKTLLEEGIIPGDIRNGLALWAAKGLHPSALPSVVNERMNSSTFAQDNRANPGTDENIRRMLAGTGTDGLGQLIALPGKDDLCPD
jgi:hypothetical protein